MKGFYTQVKAVLENHGFFCDRQKGSHQNWTNGKIAVTVSTNCHSRYTANEIMKRAGIDHRFP